jgi:hypothetical protein
VFSSSSPIGLKGFLKPLGTILEGFPKASAINILKIREKLYTSAAFGNQFMELLAAFVNPFYIGGFR